PPEAKSSKAANGYSSGLQCKSFRMDQEKWGMNWFAMEPFVSQDGLVEDYGESLENRTHMVVKPKRGGWKSTKSADAWRTMLIADLEKELKEEKRRFSIIQGNRAQHAQLIRYAIAEDLPSMISVVHQRARLINTRGRLSEEDDQFISFGFTVLQKILEHSLKDEQRVNSPEMLSTFFSFANLFDYMIFYGNDMRISSILLYNTFDRWSQVRAPDESSDEIDEILAKFERRLKKLSEEPWQTLAACMEIRDALAFPGKIEDFVSHLAVHQDGSCNGLQHYAALGRDEEGGREVNLLESEYPNDVYSSVALRVEQKRIEDEKGGPNMEIALRLRRSMPQPVPRKVIKQTVMTTVYGVTLYGAALQIKRQLKALDIDNEETAKFAQYLTHKTFASLHDAFTCSMKLKDWFRDCAKGVSDLLQTMEWVTPLGLPVVQPYVLAKEKKGKVIHVPVSTKQ
ncbi:DNA-directed RNA polymerase, partial [Teladorsagia circumcincta]